MQKGLNELQMLKVRYIPCGSAMEVEVRSAQRKEWQRRASRALESHSAMYAFECAAARSSEHEVEVGCTGLNADSFRRGKR